MYINLKFSNIFEFKQLQQLTRIIYNKFLISYSLFPPKHTRIYLTNKQIKNALKIQILNIHLQKHKKERKKTHFFIND